MSTILQNVLLWLRGAWQSRTMWASAAVVLTGAAVQLDRVVIPPAYTGWSLMVVGVAIGVLRSITSTSLAAKVAGPSAAPPAAK
jgi:hypothetical protein